MDYNTTISLASEPDSGSKVPVRFFLSKLISLLFIIDLLIGLAHLIFPYYTWGQGRDSYFNLGNSLTFASWFASVQLFATAVLAIIALKRKRSLPSGKLNSILWFIAALILILLSFIEITRLTTKTKLFGLPNPDIYEFIIVAFFQIVILVVYGWFLSYRLRNKPSFRIYAKLWPSLWGIFITLTFIKYFVPVISNTYPLFFSLLYGLTYLFGVTSLLSSVIGCVLLPKEVLETNTTILERCKISPFPEELSSVWQYIGIAGMTFTIIFIQILLFRTLNIFGTFLTANSIISIALIGIAIGGLIGWRTAKDFPMHTVIFASLLLPLTIILSLAVTVKLTGKPVLAAIILMLPFVSASSVVTILLVKTKSHKVYAIDLIGAAIGALLISPALLYFREEGSIILLALLTTLLSGCFIYYLPISRLRSILFSVVIIGSAALLTFGTLNAKNDWLNIIRTKTLLRYPQAEILFSRSSFVGRYDVIHINPKAKTIKTYDNGRVIDNMRKLKEKAYLIDPRVPSNYMKNPKILIIGLSGDGITKTSKAISNDIKGIEINPVIVDLQQNELVELNGNSYKGIDVYVMDGKSFVAQSTEKYDMITLMNAHSVRGSMRGKSASPEYLFTLEAMEDYIDHLTDRGIVNIEEPVSKPEQEPAVWKLVNTMKQALLNKGAKNPANHFYIFQWRTLRNNYIQIFMKKTPFTGEDINHLDSWLNSVDNLKEIEAETGRRIGPIWAVTTLLYSPVVNFSTNYARILNGKIGDEFFSSKNLNIITDDKPYLFSVDPEYSEEKLTYVNTFVIALLIIPFLITFLKRHKNKLQNPIPYVLVVSLSGLGYLLIEVVLIQRFQLYLGSPIISFTTVLSSLLVFSGVGSLWSGRVSNKGLYVSIFLIVSLLAVHQWLVPLFFNLSIALPVALKVIITVITIAPLAFFTGVVFPYILRKSKSVIEESAAGMLFAINAAASALAAPLALSISTVYGMKITFGTGILVYVLIFLLILSLNRKSIQSITAGIIGLLFIGILIFPLVSGSANNPENSGKYKVYGISYGHSSFDEDKVFSNASSKDEVAFEWMFWVVQGNGKTILVDTGFDNENLAKKWGVKNFQSPQKQLLKLNINPEQITDVIITHAHWDHVGALKYYINANVWMQKREFEQMKELLSDSVNSKNGINFSDLKVLLKIKQQGRLNLISDEKEIYGGITLTKCGGHTSGSQYVTIETLDGRVIVAGDNAYLYENIRRQKPIGSATDTEENLSAIMEMNYKAASPFFILPGHDPKVMRWFPEIADGIIQVTTNEIY